MLHPSDVLHHLTTGTPVVLSALPDEYGIYALHDHAGSIRYVGVTASVGVGFRKRINSRHVTGSEGYSHKFSHAYNTGRMWRSRKAMPDQKTGDARLSKALRAAFCRKHCRATYLAIAPTGNRSAFFAELTALESRVQSIAPVRMRDWEGLNCPSEGEPSLLLDEMLDEICATADFRAAVDRQAYLYQQHL